jgi:hypothetical protein
MKVHQDLHMQINLKPSDDIIKRDILLGANNSSKQPKKF